MYIGDTMIEKSMYRYTFIVNNSLVAFLAMNFLITNQ